MIYLDSSALVKLVHPEPDSDQLVSWLTTERLPMISSALAEHAFVAYDKRLLAAASAAGLTTAHPTATSD